MASDLGVAFLAGLLSCASACVLPLVPIFVAYLGGVSVSGGRVGPRRRLGVVGNAGLFVAGFGTAFTLLGAAAGLLGGGLELSYRPTLVTASGALLVLLGVALLVGGPWLRWERRLQVAHRLPRTPAASYAVGLAFAVGWTPCVGPILAAILVEAAQQSTAARGALLLAAYSAGLGLPFLATAAFIAPVSGLLARLRGGHAVVTTLAAALLIALGVLTLTNRLTAVNGLFPTIGPAPAGQLSAAAPAGRGATTLVGRPAPAATVTSVDGTRLALRQVRGAPVVVTFFATWCLPCRDELPLFAAAARDHRDQRLVVVAVDYEESAGAVRGFWRDLGLDLTPYLDPDGSVAHRFGVGLQETGLPFTVLVDRSGTVRSILPGQLGAAQLDSQLNGVLRGQVPRTSAH
jgi:cytochrome c-type biogenesis protein